jgi:arylsulfatase A-like enzyme
MRTQRHRIIRVLAVLTLVVLAAACSRVPERPNIAIVVLDTARGDYVGSAPGRPGVTPNVDRLARDGTAFTRVWANASWTVPSHVSIFTGLLPSEHGCTGKALAFRDDVPTAAGILSAAGYETAAFYSNPWLTDQLTGMMRGFGTQEVASPPDRQLLRVLSQRDQGGPETIGNVERWLDRRDPERPFFAFVNLLEPHLPYAPPPEYREIRPSDLPVDDAISTLWAGEFNAGLHVSQDVDWDRVRYLYAGDVWTSDQLLGRLVTLLEDRGLLDDTVLIVTSDHGENLGDHGFLDHQFGVFETLLSVPLVIRAPGRLPSGERDDPVMLSDLFATVLDLAGVDDLGRPEHSRSLLDAPADPSRPLIAEYEGAKRALLRQLQELNPGLDVELLGRAFGAVRVGDLRLTVGSDGSVLLHDLSVDPGQERNLAAERPDDVERLRGLLPAFRHERGPDVEIDERMREWLGSLGYVM